MLTIKTTIPKSAENKSKIYTARFRNEFHDLQRMLSAVYVAALCGRTIDFVDVIPPKSKQTGLISLIIKPADKNSNKAKQLMKKFRNLGFTKDNSFQTGFSTLG